MRKQPPAKPTLKAGERAAKILSRAGVASRREAERLIEARRIYLNGAPLTNPAIPITSSDVLTYDGKPLPKPEISAIWRFHKPKGVITARKDTKNRPTIYDRLPKNLLSLMPIGRLDFNSEGLLLLVNDGAVKRYIELPSSGWTRRYRIRAHGISQDDQLNPLREGIKLGSENLLPMQVSIDRVQGRNCWLTVGLKEGRNREIRRAFEYLGFPVSRLIRIAVGPFQLGKLAAGSVEKVPERVFQSALGNFAKV